MAQITKNNRHTVRAGTLQRPIRSMFGVSETDLAILARPHFSRIGREVPLRTRLVPNESPLGCYAPH